MKKQRDIFLAAEADNWFKRNEDLVLLKSGNDIIISVMDKLNIKPVSVLEVGCANGFRLNEINRKYNASVSGIEPSEKAILHGKQKFSNVDFTLGTADRLPYNDNKFDLVIYGFCLYLCDREDLFKIAAEGDRVLKSKGIIIIMDFSSSIPYLNEYSHLKGVNSYKMNYSSMFLWNPIYTLKYKHVFSHDGSEAIENKDDRISVEILLKQEHGYISNPFKA